MPRVENTQIRQAPTSPKERKTDKPDRPGYAGAMTQKERNKDGVLKHISEKSKKLGTFALSLFSDRSEIHDARIVLQKLAAIARNLRGYTAGIFDAALAQVIQHAAETVVPLLFFLVRLAWVSRAELDEEFFTCGGARRR
jgi:hypothetical protein